MPNRAASAVTAGDGSGPTVVFTPATAWATDDDVILQLYVEDLTLTPSFDKGSWTKITGASGKNNNATVPFETHVYWCRWDDAITGDVTISWGGASVWRNLVATAYSGRLASGDPQDATATYNELESAGTALTANAVTTANANADVVATGANLGGTTYTWSVITERVDFGGSSIADVLQAGAGSSGNKTATLATGFAWSAGLVALREAVSAAGATAQRQPHRPFSSKPSGSRFH